MKWLGQTVVVAHHALHNPFTIQQCTMYTATGRDVERHVQRAAALLPGPRINSPPTTKRRRSHDYLGTRCMTSSPTHLASNVLTRHHHRYQRPSSSSSSLPSESSRLTSNSSSSSSNRTTTACFCLRSALRSVHHQTGMHGTTRGLWESVQLSTYHKASLWLKQCKGSVANFGGRHVYIVGR